MKIQILGPTSRNNEIAKHLSREHDVFVTEEQIGLSDLESKRINFLICNGYAPILKPPITDIFKKRIINIHPASLPNGRGIFPNFWSFFEGYPQEATIHYIDSGIDTGGVLIRESIIPAEQDTLRSILQKLMSLAERLFIDNSKEILAGNIDPIPQSSLSYQSFYHNRIISEMFIELLPDRWDTKVTDVIKMGRMYALNRQCVQIYVEDVQNAS